MKEGQTWEFTCCGGERFTGVLEYIDRKAESYSFRLNAHRTISVKWSDITDPVIVKNP